MFITLLELYSFALALADWMIVATDYDDELSFGQGLWAGIKNYPTLVVVIIVSLIIAGFTLKLFHRHIRLICHSLSTYEYLKNHFKGALFNPYEKSCGTSMANVLCKRRP